MKDSNVNSFLTITEDEFKSDMEHYFKCIDNGTSPMRIKCDNGKDLLIFDWNDYMENFSCLHTKEELAELEKG